MSIAVPRDSLVLLMVLTLVPVANGQQAAGNDQLAAEVAAARVALQQHPKFQKYYEHLAANPDTLPVNGPKLAVLLAAEAQTSAAIKDHPPSLLGTWQEVMRLAAAGNDYKTAFPAIDALQKHPSGLLTAAAARLAKGNLLAAASAANATKPVAGEREALLELVRPLLKEALAANDVAALRPLLAADSKLSWSTTESANSIQLLLPLAQQATDGNRPALAKLLFDHLDSLVAKTAAGKSRKEFADAIAAARERFAAVDGAQQALQTLATKPLDPTANQAYGKYLLACGQTRESLTYLALGSDAEWKKLAAESLEVKTAADKVALADRWMATAKDGAEGGKSFARLFYEEALADKSFVGIPRAAAEEKLKSLGPAPATVKPVLAAVGNKPLPPNEWVDVLPLIDIDQDLVCGYWTKGPQNTLLCDQALHPKLRLPVLLAGSSYDLTVEFKLAEAKSDVYLLVPVGDRLSWLLVDSWTNGDRCFFSIPDGPNVYRNLLHANQAYRYEINVRLSGDQVQLTFSLNGEKILEYKGPVSAIKSPNENPLGTFAQPGLSTYFDRIQYTRIQVRAIDGPAAIGRAVPLIKPIPPEILALKATRLATLKPLAGRARYDYLSVSTPPAKMEGGRHPLLGGAECRDYLFAHAPSSLSYAIPAKTKYFTAIAYAAKSQSVKFIVKVDGKPLFDVERKAIAPVVVEIPEGAKVLELICEDLGDSNYDHSSWCFPAFRQ